MAIIIPFNSTSNISHIHSVIKRKRIKYWKTQVILKRKWLLNKWPFGSSGEFKRFVILCDPRTGSTWLHTLLNSSAQIMSYGEVLTELDLRDGLESNIWKSHHHSIKIVGCKIFYEQLVLPQFEPILNEIETNQAIKIIDLRRENKVETFVSLKIAEQTQAWSGDAKKTEKREKVFVHMSELMRFIDSQQAVRATVLNSLKKHQVYPLSYEQLMNETDHELEEIQKYLGVNPQSLFSLLEKQNPEPIEDLISNYEEIKDELFTLLAKR